MTFLLAASLFFASNARLIESALLIEDSKSALALAHKNFTQHPDEKSSYNLLIRACGAASHEDEMLKIYDEFKEKFPDDALSENLLESIAFCILKKGYSSSKLAVKQISLIALALTQDIESIKAIKEAMRDGNKAIRALAVSLSGYFGDASLKMEMAHLLEKERSSEVRAALYESIAKLKIKEFLGSLIQRAKDPNLSQSERKKILAAIFSISEKFERDEIESLAKSPFSIFRVIAAKSALLEGAENQDIIDALLNDYHIDVSASALETCACLRRGSIEALDRLMHDSRPEIAALSAKTLLLLDKEKGRDAFFRLLNTNQIEKKRMVAAALASSGPSGRELLESLIEKEDDPYILCYAGLAFIEERKNVEKGGDFIYSFLEKVKEPLMEGETHFFSIIKSTLDFHPLIPNIRASKDLSLRFKLLNLLAIVDHPKAKEALFQFLKNIKFELGSLAAEILLGEGDESIISHLEGFLNESDLKIKREASLLLASQKVESAIPRIKELYRSAQIQDRLIFLEALGSFGDKNLIPFFIEELKNPSQTIRVASAAMLVKTMRS